MFQWLRRHGRWIKYSTGSPREIYAFLLSPDTYQKYAHMTLTKKTLLSRGVSGKTYRATFQRKRKRKRKKTTNPCSGWEFHTGNPVTSGQNVYISFAYPRALLVCLYSGILLVFFCFFSSYVLMLKLTQAQIVLLLLISGTWAFAVWIWSTSLRRSLHLFRMKV